MQEEKKESIGELMGALASCVAKANEDGERIYSMHYYGAKWFEITVREKTFGNSREVVRKDTRVSAENLREALRVMEQEPGA